MNREPREPDRELRKPRQTAGYFQPMHTLSHSYAPSLRGRLDNNETALQNQIHRADKDASNLWAAPETREGPHNGCSGRAL